MTNPSPPGGPPDKSRPFGMAYRSLPALRKGLSTLGDGLQTTPGPPGLPPNHSLSSGSPSRPSRSDFRSTGSAT